MFDKVSCSLSAAQQEVCLAISQSGHNLNYHLCDVLEFHGELDLSKLEQAIQVQFTETETLRTTLDIQAETGLFTQFIHAPDSQAGKKLDFHDVSISQDPEQEYERLLCNLLSQDMDLINGPLARYIVVRLAPSQYRIIELASHLVVDGWGHGILSGNIAAHYNKLCRGETVEARNLPPLSSIFTAENEYRNSKMMVKDQAYWQKYCLALPEPTQLVPGDAPLVNLNRLRKVFDGPVLHQLREVTSEHKLRMSSVLMALCATYLHRLTGQSELAVGMPVAARQIKALRDVPSMVANILPLHLSFDENSTVVSVASNIQRQLRRHLLHQTYRFEEMIRDLYDERGNKPLFKTLLNVVAYDQGANFDGGETRIQNVANGPASHLGIDIFDRNKDGRLEIGFNANAELFSNEALEMHYQRLTLLLARFVEAPNTPAADYNLFFDGEYERLYSLPDKAAELPVFADAFNTSVNKHASKYALSQGNRQISYSMLNDYADRLASHLQQQGVSQNDSVAVVVSRSIEWAVAAVALLKLGAAYVPVDPELPEGRIEHILSDAAPAQILVSPGLALNVNVPTEKVLYLTTEVFEQLPTARQSVYNVDPNSLAYLIYTSGSTGKPKGVEVTHRNLVPIARTAIEAADLQPSEKVLQFIAAGFDMSVLEIMMTLLAGATLVITDKVASTPGKPLAKLVKRENIDLLVMTPSLLAYHKTEDFRQGTRLLLGGEACTPALLSRFSHCRLLNVYGPTETSFATSINAKFGTNDLSIGPPTANTRLYVVDKQQQPLPPGSWGELFIGGPGVAQGYRNQPELTAKGFVPDLLDESTTMYRVGDRVYFDSEKCIHYLGRQDNQIKLRGLRIELDEIKNALLSCSDVEDAVALLSELPHGPAIVGYVVCKDAALESDRLKQAVSRQLPHHMIPSVIMTVEEFPLTSNGKLAVRQLPSPVIIDNTEKLLPTTAEEETMCSLFASTLERNQVYANENFFELGGHSLLGLQLINRINEAFGVTLGISDFLAAPSPRQLVQRLDPSVSYSDPFDSMLPLRVEGNRPPLFCIHPGGGIAWPYAGLLPFLPEDQPVYAIQSPILRDPNRIVGSLDELAKEYLQKIQAIQPEGPYQLAGWSVGGNLSLRMAAMLQAQGHQVSFLCMFDSYPLQGGQASLKLDDATVITRMTRAIVGTPRAGMKGLKSAMDEVLGKNDVGDDFLTRIVEDSKLMLDLLANCRYDRFNGDLLFIRATTDILRTEEQQPALWSPYVSGSLIEYEVDAPHECLLQRQYLEQFGDHFASELLKRQSEALNSEQVADV
ncbi:amino acid adenylation domain-containing protein [Photobacterium alginatilyticum]|uniref:amino acid adenylation domain-containing protein n=1 Tax=Photobacterium alginatilyticum TaxID=1775171 RepID=UPI004068EFD8